MMNKLIIVLSVLVSFPGIVFAQTSLVDSNGLKIIKITHADSIVGYNDQVHQYQSLIGAVGIEHDGVIMTCDSAHLFQAQNMVEAFSQVHIAKAGGSEAFSNYIKYTGDDNLAFMQGAVQIIDGKNTLQTEELTYNVKTKIGRYTKSGNLQTEETNVSSEFGTYNGFLQQAYFEKDVVITNPKYTILSKKLNYNTKTEEVNFVDSSEISTDKSVINTKVGNYNAKTTHAVFTSRTRIQNDDQIIEGDYITYEDKTGSAFAKGKVMIEDLKNNSIVYSDIARYNKLTGDGSAEGHVYIVREKGKNTLNAERVEYNKKNGYAKATEHVILLDTTERSQLLAECVEFNENSKFMLATQHPKLITVNDKDSLFMRADTILSMRLKDQPDLKRILIFADKKTGLKTYAYNLLYADSTYKSDADSTSPKLLIANRTVKLYSDSMQAVCDSLHYSQFDSTFKLFKGPILWSKSQQASADTIFMKTRNNKLSEANLISNALLISIIGIENVYDQVSGNYVDAFFTNNEIREVFVNQNAQSLYYARDDQGAFIGLNQSESASMNVYFQNKELDRIVMHEHPKGVFKPIDKLQESDKFLKEFKLLTEYKPKNKEEIMEN